MRTASRLLAASLLVAVLFLGTAPDTAAAPTTSSPVLRDQLFRLEHLIHALQAEIEALEVRLERLEARLSTP